MSVIDHVAPGTVLKGKYSIEERLGAGGMAVVYRARNIAVDRTVAIKVLNTQLAQNATAVTRFKREARAANQARHPHIVDVLDVDQDGDVLFIVQEYLEGEDLAARLERDGRIPAEEALDIMLPIIEAVGAAHDKGVVHRDLKPDNVFLVDQGGTIVPKILDFGISKMPLTDMRTTGPGGPPVKMKAGRITVAGMAMGTPYYMSPEQIRDPGGVDKRTDIWSIGVMLYEVLSGLMPFDADDMGQLFARIHTHEARRLDKFIDGVDAAVGKVVHRCLRVEREERYASGSELARALQRARVQIDDEMSVVGDKPVAPPGKRLPFAATRESERGAAKGTMDLELDLGGSSRGAGPLSSPEPAASEPARSASASSASASSASASSVSASSSSAGSAPKPSGGGLSLELDLPVKSQPEPSVPTAVSSVPSSGGAPGSGAAPSAFDFDDDDDDDDLFPSMDLAVDVPGSSGSVGGGMSGGGLGGGGAKPRIARTSNERGPESRRRIHLRGHAGKKQAAAYLRMMLGGLVVAALAIGSTYLTPEGMRTAWEELGSRMALVYGGAAIASVVALTVTLSNGLRHVSYGLFLASAGLTLTTIGIGGALVVYTAPGLVPSNIVTIALLIAPHAALATVLGYILFAISFGRELRKHEDERLIGTLLLVMAVLGVGASAWIVRKPSASLVTIQKIRSPHAEPMRESMRRFGVNLHGAQVQPKTLDVELRTSRIGAAAVGPVSVELRKPE